MYRNIRKLGMHPPGVDTHIRISYDRHTFPGRSIPGNLALTRVSDRIGRNFSFIDKWCLLDVFTGRKLRRKELR